MSARIQQARISGEYIAGDVQSHQNSANEPALVACDSNEEIEYQKLANAQTLLENNALKTLLIDLLRAVDAAEVRIPESHLAAVKRDLILLESRTVPKCDRGSQTCISMTCATRRLAGSLNRV